MKESKVEKTSRYIGAASIVSLLVVLMVVFGAGVEVILMPLAFLVGSVLIGGLIGVAIAHVKERDAARHHHAHRSTHAAIDLQLQENQAHDLHEMNIINEPFTSISQSHQPTGSKSGLFAKQSNDVKQRASNENNYRWW